MSRPLIRAIVPIAVALASSLPAQGFLFDYRPNAREVVLDTDSTQITATNGQTFNVTGGVFVFRNVHIPSGVLVRAVGSRPMIWVVSGEFRVDGELNCDGEDGVRVDTLNSANFPTPGGVAGPAGGRGGRGSPNSTDRSFAGEGGFGPGNIPAFGGRGGRLSCTTSCNRGSGGGGGSFATQGDPYYAVGADPRIWPQVFGNGGEGCLNRSLPGGAAGFQPFLDGRVDNDFLGVQYDIARNAWVVGELPFPIGGSGGGGGGDRSIRCSTNDPAFINDNKGGGGGAGGGALLILARGRIVVASTGLVSADGGNGGGGEQAGANNQGAGGGGGSGGMIAMLSETEIELHVHGETYANGDYRFAVSADGGIGTQGRFGGLEIGSKYPPGTAAWARKPAGGFGGLGLIEFIAPIGSNRDGTNTVLDDNIKLVANGQALTGAEKQRYLAWRGFPQIGGGYLDDAGQAVQVGRDIGDVQPTPVLLPLLR